MTCNTYDSPASKYSVKALTVDQLRNKIYSFDDLLKIENNPALRYPVQDLSNALFATLTNFSLVNSADYPLITNRLSQGEIPISEYADFLSNSGYTPTQVTTIFSGVAVATVPMSSYYDQLEFYYNDNLSKSISGGFCAAFTGALAALNQLVSAGVALISQLKNAAAAFIAQLMSIKELLFKIVDELKQKMLQMVQNVVDQINQIKTRITSVMNFFNEKIRKVKEFFSDLNIKNLKTKIEEIIAKMAGGFEEITPEVIAYLLFRLCQLSEIISNFMQSPVDSLKGLLANFAIQELKLSNISNSARIGSVTAGGYRRDPFEIIKEREAIANSVNSAASPGVYGKSYITKPFTPEELAMVQALTENGNQHIEFSSRVINQNDPIVGAGWKKVVPDIYIILFRVSKRMGKRFLINSGYRSPDYNEKQRGSAKNSLHMSGLALDVDMSRHGNTVEFRNMFIEYASQEGAGGIGIYPNSGFIHIDVGPRRAWGPNNSRSSLPGTGNEAAANLHMDDKFRNGSGTPSNVIPTTAPTPSTSTTSIPSDPRLDIATQNQKPAATGGATTIDTGGIVLDSTNVFGA